MEQTVVRELAEKVSSYFLAFLETDFKKQRAPRRKIQTRTENNLLSSIRLRRYPTLNRAVHDLMYKHVSEGLELRVAQNQHRSPLSSTLGNLIEQHVAAIPNEHFTAAIQRTLALAKESVGKASKHPGQWVQSVVEGLMSAIANEVVVPLLTLLDGPLQEDARSPIDSAFALESDIVALLSNQASDALPQTLNTYLVTMDLKPATAVLMDCLDPSECRRLLKDYFGAFATTDAYYELHDLATYLKTGDNLQFYLYAGTISFGHNTYPIFYIPGTLVPTKDKPEYTIQFDPHVYVNKAAIDFILQERTAASRHTGASPITDRILYLTSEDKILAAIASKMPKICTSVELPVTVNISNSDHEKSRTVEVAIDNALLFAGFDKSDEAILNDYEDLLIKLHSSNEEVTALFEDIITGVILDDPVSVRKNVDAAQQGERLASRMVVESPIPINDEQREILFALKEPTCRFVVVEGPPGTGKSHTITALAFDAIMHGKSTLVLSDKTEALDVVEDKLNSALSAVRGDDDFQNPILRLGCQGANYRKLTSKAVLTQLRTHHTAQRANRTKLDTELNTVKQWLGSEIEKTLSIYTKLTMVELAAVINAEKQLEATNGKEFVSAVNRLTEDKKSIEVFASLSGINIPELSSRFDALLEGARYPSLVDLDWDLRLADIACTLNAELPAPLEALDLLKPLSADGAKKCHDYLLRFTSLKRPLIGYLLRAKDIAAMEQEFLATNLTRGPLDLRRDGVKVKTLVDFVLNLIGNLDKYALTLESLEGVQRWMRKRPNTIGLTAAIKVIGHWVEIAAKEPVLGEMRNRKVGEMVQVILDAAHYAYDRYRIVSAFARLPQLDYLSDKTKLERLYTSKMTDIVDERFLNFAEQQAAKMKTLAGIISARARFPTDHFDALRNACPIILASIREFAEYMPLQKGLFDLVIIDEGSQVSIAQALPAILRGKQIVVFGDSRQFSNVKSSNASIERNNVYKSDLTAFFRAKIGDDAARITRLSTFDVKASVLEFFDYCANFHTMLRKHFRGPQELISFSSENFYNRQLQAIKIRGLPMDETIRFDVVSSQEGQETARNVNVAEAEFILGKLRAMLEDEIPPTVGVITPFREQQIYLTRVLTQATEWPDFDSKMRIKVMTFDSCQGEEREVIFYSMVATRDLDVLNYVFPASFKINPDDVEGKLKLQRLNVGFSRAQETIWFVLSKEVSEYRGSVAYVLNHYKRVLEERRHGDSADTDPRSPMEPQVLTWLQATPFVQEHADDIEIQPGFQIGRYLKQLDPTYHHPMWKVDFLVTVQLESQLVKVIIEYDGFEFHFNNARGVNAGNYETYMNEADLYRQLVLEGYGYHFLRINRFNLGHDPIKTLSERLQKLLDGAVTDSLSVTANDVIRIRNDIQNGTQKECSRCHKVKPLEAFFDATLKKGEGGHGRVCQTCKGVHQQSSRPWRRRRRW